MIPKRLHYVWVGGKPLPRRFQRNIRSWMRHHPGYELICWNEETIDWSREPLRAARERRAWATVADIVRLHAVRELGGIYLDTDVEVVRPFDRLLDRGCFVGIQARDPGDILVNNAVFGVVPGHWLIAEACAALPSSLGSAGEISFGPALISDLLRRHGLIDASDDETEVAGVSVLPRRVFYPYHWTEDYTPGCITVDTLALHHWELSWHRQNASWPIRIASEVLRSRLHRSLRASVDECMLPSSHPPSF